MADLKRNTIANREFVERNYLPDGWKITQNHFGQYAKISYNEQSSDAYYSESWKELVAWAQGYSAAVWACKQAAKDDAA